MLGPAQQQRQRVTGSITRTMPPANFQLSSDITLRSMGLVGGHLHGHYSIVDGTHYVWFRQGTASPDPGTYVAALGGLTGVRVDLPASSQTATQVATAVAAALTGAGFTASSVGADVTVNGSTWTPGAISYVESAYQGMVGVHHADIEDNFSVGGLNGLRLVQIVPSALPATNFIINGLAIRIGDNHTDPIAVGVYQGGAADDDLTGATYLGPLGATDPANGANVWDYIQSEGVIVDPTAGRVWIAFSSPSASTQLEFTITSQPQGSTSSFVIHNTNRCAIESNVADSVATADPTTFTATLTGTGALETGVPPFRVAIQEISSLQSDMRPTFEFGTMVNKLNGVRDNASPISVSSSLNEFFVGNSYDIPADMFGLELHSIWICYEDYLTGDDYRMSLGQGGAAFNDFDGATFYDVGQTSNGSSGWNQVLSPAGVPLAAGQRAWLMLKSQGGGTTSLNFVPTGQVNQFEGVQWGPALFYNGETSESERSATNPLVTNPPNPEPGINYDPAVADPVGVYTAAANSNITSNNNVGVRAAAVTVGWA